MATKTPKKKATPKPKAAEPRRRNEYIKSRAFEDEIVSRVQKFVSVNATLAGTLGAEVPPHDPFELIAYENTWHEACMRRKLGALVGQGYEASPALRAHIDRPNAKYTFTDLLYRVTRDYIEHGNCYIEAVVGKETSALYHSPAVKTRIKFDKKREEKSYLRFQTFFNKTDLRTWIGYLDFPEFEPGVQHGIKHLRTPGSKTGNDYYGDPTWIASKPLLRMNWNIIKSANRFFDHALMADLAMIEKGMGREPEDVEAIKEYLTDHAFGADNAHKLLYLQVAPDEEIKFEKLSSDFPGKESTEVRKANREEIIANHDCYPKLVAVEGAGAIGVVGEFEGQVMAFKIFYADPEQRFVEAWWQKLFEELGFPEANTFRLKPMDTTAGQTDAQTLTMLTGGQPIISVDEARQDWFTEKSMRGLIHFLRKVKEELA